MEHSKHEIQKNIFHIIDIFFIFTNPHIQLSFMKIYDTFSIQYFGLLGILLYLTLLYPYMLVRVIQI